MGIEEFSAHYIVLLDNGSTIRPRHVDPLARTLGRHRLVLCVEGGGALELAKVSLP